MAETRLKVAIVGCGAISERLHMPGLAKRDDCEIVALVDTNAQRCNSLARQFNAAHAFTDHNDLLKHDIDAAIVAAPNNLHASISMALLNAGIHVLVEKPLAISATECEQLAAASEDSGKILAVGHILRFAHAARFAKWAVDSGILGRILSFDVRYGFVFAWPTASDYFLRKELSGGGVLIDLGAHAIDLLLWWLGDFATFDYYDDNYGGVEADCLLQATLQSGVTGTVELSRTRDLRSTAIIRGEHAELEIGIVENSVTLKFQNGGIGLTGHAMLDGQPVLATQRTSDLVIDEHADFFAAIKSGRSPMIPAADARRSVELIEACYAARQPLELPWVNSQAGVMPEAQP